MLHEVLIHRTGSERGRSFMRQMGAALRAHGALVRTGWHYAGVGKVLFLYGVGAADRRQARMQHLAAHRHVVTFDLGYFCRSTHMRMTIDVDHPQKYLDITPNDSIRWSRLGVTLTEDYKATGPIILIGMGKKTHRIPGVSGWEEAKLAELQQRFPQREILYRPKPGGTSQIVLPLGLRVLPQEIPFQKVLRGASLVVCRHSNAAVDAVVAGVPFEADDGAATWILGKEYSVANRLDFLHRLAYWQWHEGELKDCLHFLFQVLQTLPRP